MEKKLWKVLKSGMKSNYDGHKWEIGQWYKTDCRKLCEGFNCSTRVIDAMQYVAPEIIAEVETRGTHYIGTDKQTWEEMRIVRAWRWEKKDSVALAIYAAELVLIIYEKKYPTDNRPRLAIEAARKWLADPTKDAAEAAMAAARAAARAAEAAAWVAEAAWAAEAAEVAARAAEEAEVAGVARAAAWAARAADAAARAAAWAAETAGVAREKILNECEEWIQRHITTLREMEAENGQN